MRSYEISRVHVHEAVSTMGIVICLTQWDNPNIVLHTRVKKMEKVKESGSFLFENELFTYLLFTVISNILF